LRVLIAEKRVLVQKIPREKAKSALGYIRASAWPRIAVPSGEAVMRGNMNAVDQSKRAIIEFRRMLESGIATLQD
jgi:hypothetical protein